MSNITYYATALNHYSRWLCMSHGEIVNGLKEWWAAWRAHPDFEGFYQPDSWGYAPDADNLFAPMVLAAFDHERGVDNRTQSYVLGTLPDACSRLEWGRQRLGEFVGIQPIRPDFSPNRYRISYVSYSLGGNGKGYWARQRLKQYLPKELHPLINGVRRVRKMRLEGDYRTKKAWFFSGNGRFSNTPERLIKLNFYMNNDDFWACATAQIHPEDVKQYVNHQLSMEALWG